MTKVYYKIKSSEEPVKELYLRSYEGGFKHYGYRYEGGMEFTDKKEAFQVAKENMGFVVELEEKVIGGWGFFDEEGTVTYDRWKE